MPIETKKENINPIREKVNKRLDDLELPLNEQQHFQQDGVLHVISLIESVSKFWRILHDSERDFINGARYAIEERLKWN
ncbi:hypothetical protein [Pseudogemmobacter sp. W21_MBD1_M6]|uniref:hypothetical protein n=1 Tax=Pseudogemmobacter sp. W21_MBD1_M6 TaxID=3240271 RepID=UPI003F945E7D